jgi:hypothetical protein
MPEMTMGFVDVFCKSLAKLGFCPVLCDKCNVHYWEHKFYLNRQKEARMELRRIDGYRRFEPDI